jgi:hypothetical protein
MNGLEEALDSIEMHPEDEEKTEDWIDTIKREGAKVANAIWVSDRLKMMIMTSKGIPVQRVALLCLSELTLISEPAKACFAEIYASGLVTKISDLAKREDVVGKAFLALMNSPYKSADANEASALIVAHIRQFPELIPYMRQEMYDLLSLGIPNDGSQNVLVTLLCLQDIPEFSMLTDELTFSGKLTNIISETKKRRSWKWWRFW